VLVPETYTRNAGGEPSKVLREDGSYTLYEYDAALKLSKEVVYNPAGGLVESIEYSYDLDGKRTKKVDAAGTHNYNYNANGQLATVGQDGYVYDVDGRLQQFNRDGKTVVLSHDAFDHLTQVSVNGVNTQYLYDAQGNRIGEVGGGNTKNYLVAPNLGNGLESTDLVTDGNGNGNVVSDYVYGGSNITARLDTNGDPIYYLTDSMGSVIGLVDGNGNRVSRIVYDGFGEVKSGDDGTSLGGDFRFQGQWLETESGLYYMRARDYDAKTGLFLSRDAVDVQEQGIEAFNPYQFGFNNPLIYSDPSGLFTLSEVNIAQSISDTLNAIQRNSQSAIARRAINEARGVATELFVNTAKQILPFSNEINIFSSSVQGTLFEKFMQNAICALMSTAFSNFTDYVWLEVGVNSNGIPQNNGRIKCSNSTPVQVAPGNGPSSKYSNPDFVIKRGGPASTSPQPFPPKGDPAFLIGDFKRSVTSIKTSGKGSNQWNAIMKYSRAVWQYPSPGQQYVPVALYVTLYDNPTKEASLKRKAMTTYGVRLEVISFLPKK
jgi:RHS repeat-associated protein